MRFYKEITVKICYYACNVNDINKTETSKELSKTIEYLKYHVHSRINCLDSRDGVMSAEAIHL